MEREEDIAWEETIEEIQQDDKDICYEEPVSEEIQTEDAFQEENLDISEHLSLKIDVSRQPDIYQIIHISRLLSLEHYLSENQVINTEEEKDADWEKIPKIAVVIDDMGASLVRTKEITEIKAPLTSSFVTFASQLNRQIAAAKKAGHEIMIHVPMQPKSNIFVSDDVLKVDMTAEQIADGFSEMLKKFDDPVGINNHMGSLFTEHQEKLAPIMKILSERQMFFLDSKTTAFSQGEATAKEYGVPTVHRHVFLDNENDLAYILGQLELAERIAKSNGYAIAIGHPKSQTSRALEIWLKTLPEKKIELIPLSQIIAYVSRQVENSFN